MTKKISGLVNFTSIEASDILAVVDVSEGTAGSGKITLTNLLASLITILANDQIPWAKVNKATSNINEIVTRLATDLQISADDKIICRVGGTVSEITCTTFIRTLLDDADAATARTTLGVSNDHTALVNKGTYTHAEIDTHIADSDKHREISVEKILVDPGSGSGSASGSLADYWTLSTYVDSASGSVSASGSIDTIEYYYNASGIIEGKPYEVKINDVVATEGTVGQLNHGEWGWGDLDSIGEDRIYVCLDDASDPDSKSYGYIKCNYTTVELLSAYKIYTDFAAKVHTHTESDITDLLHDAEKIRTKTVEVPAIDKDNKFLMYDHAAGQYIHENARSAAMGIFGGNADSTYVNDGIFGGNADSF